MKEIGLKSYRFSIRWARIFPNADGKVNERGVKFYKSLVDELINAGITPICWDLPLWLHELGGWENEEIIEHFVRYAEECVKALSDKIEYWLTLNEPGSFIDGGYRSGVHAPFLKLPEEGQRAVTRIAMLAHGKAVAARGNKGIERTKIKSQNRTTKV